MNNIVLPPPTPKDIEAALTAIRNGTSAYGRWVRLMTTTSAEAEADRLWWVDIINPEGVQEMVWRRYDFGRSGSSRVDQHLSTAWWVQPGLSDEDDAKVPRHVPEGWQFELLRTPCDPPSGARREARLSNPGGTRSTTRTLATLRRKSIAQSEHSEAVSSVVGNA